MHFRSLRKIIAKYQRQQTSAEVNVILEKWVDTIKDKSQVKEHTQEAEKAAIRHRIFEQIKAKTQPKAKVVTLQPWMRVAAALIPLVIAIAYGIFYSKADREITIQTALGEYKEVQLPDSSKVLLHQNSSLHYPAHFTETRTVVLSGQAFFDVTRDTLRKFEVLTNSVQVEVLGTSFEVRAYEEWAESTVSVHTGKVKVSDQQGALSTLYPNDKLSYSNALQNFIVQTVSNAPIDRNMISFENTSLQEVLATLQNFYPVSFSNTAITKSVRLSGSFDRSMSVDQIIVAVNSILENHHLTIEKRNNDEYYLK